MNGMMIGTNHKATIWKEQMFFNGKIIYKLDVMGIYPLAI
jgi:hypothetical protein